MWPQRRTGLVTLSFRAMTSFSLDSSRETFLLQVLNKRAVYIIVIALFRSCMRYIQRLKHSISHAILAFDVGSEPDLVDDARWNVLFAVLQIRELSEEARCLATPLLVSLLELK